MPSQAPTEGVDPRTVFKVKAKTRLKLEQRGLQFLGDTADWRYFVIPDDALASKFLTELDQYVAGTGPNVLRQFFGNIEGIERYGPSDRAGPGLPTGDFSGVALVDVLLWASSDDIEARRRLDDVFAVVRASQGEIIDSDHRPLSTMARVRVPLRGLDALLDLMVVERVRVPVAPFLEPSDWITATADDLTAGVPIDVTVGVIDDGVHSGHPLLRDVVVSECAIPSDRQWNVPGTHGSMVAGLAAYGDFEKSLREGSPFPAPTRLALIRVLEPDPNNPTVAGFPSETPEHVVIESAVRKLHEQGVRIINLSIADSYAYSGPHVSLWTETLDRLALELDVLIVTVTGNRPFAPSGELREHVSAQGSYPEYVFDSEARIAEPGIAANVVTVGSVARSGAAARVGGRSDVRDTAIAQLNEISPFSRTGPGVHATSQNGTIKPEFVHYGGNTVWTALGQISHNDPGASAVSTALHDSGRLFSAASGTSFAAPRVARTAAEILRTYPKASANLLRALLGVAAQIPGAAMGQFSDKKQRHRAFGYGIPKRERAVDSDRNRVVLIHEGEIAVDTVAIHPIPMPENFTTGKSDRTITVAVACDPPVRRQRREYTAGRVTLDFYRATDIDEVEAWVRRQPRNGAIPLPQDRRRIGSKLKPGAQLCGASTLQVRTWSASSANALDPDDSDTYFLVVRHLRESWADNLRESYKTQRYALAVQLEDRSTIDINLYASVEAQVRARAQADMSR